MTQTGKLVLVTVGTTEFDELIQAIDQEAFLVELQKFGFQRLLVQVGRGSYTPKLLGQCQCQEASLLRAKHSISVEVIRFHDNLAAVINECALLIGHCGAGTILDAVGSAAGTKMIVVINDSLQGNHQMELAGMLMSRGVCRVTSPAGLLGTLAQAHRDNLLGAMPMPMPMHSQRSQRGQQQASFPILEAERFAATVEGMFDFS